MSDAVKCGICGRIYWTGSYENWGTCDRCGSNNDHAPVNKRPVLTTSDALSQQWAGMEGALPVYNKTT
jgi:predicted  nucleic acid-binding Zn-ribbon protein